MAKKLNKKDLDQYRDLLHEKRAALTGSINRFEQDIEGSGLSGAGGDSADQGTGTFEQDFALSMMQSEGDLVQEIDGALERIEDGSFGICLTCEKRILKARLTAIPWTSYCIDCQRSAEAS